MILAVVDKGMWRFFEWIEGDLIRMFWWSDDWQFVLKFEKVLVMGKRNKECSEEMPVRDWKWMMRCGIWEWLCIGAKAAIEAKPLVKRTTVDGDKYTILRLYKLLVSSNTTLGNLDSYLNYFKLIFEEELSRWGLTTLERMRSRG